MSKTENGSCENYFSLSSFFLWWNHQVSSAFYVSVSTDNAGAKFHITFWSRIQSGIFSKNNESSKISYEIGSCSVSSWEPFPKATDGKPQVGYCVKDSVVWHQLHLFWRETDSPPQGCLLQTGQAGDRQMDKSMLRRVSGCSRSSSARTWQTGWWRPD